MNAVIPEESGEAKIIRKLGWYKMIPRPGKEGGYPFLTLLAWRIRGYEGLSPQEARATADAFSEKGIFSGLFVYCYYAAAFISLFGLAAFFCFSAFMTGIVFADDLF